jgi:hypothetical protein
MSLLEIKESVAQLAEREKGDLAAWLLESLPPHGQEDALHDSLTEAARRREELDSGEVRPLPADEFWAAIERERASWK